MEEIDLFAMSDSVASKETFLDFLAALEVSWKLDPDRSENGSIPRSSRPAEPGPG